MQELQWHFNVKNRIQKTSLLPNKPVKINELPPSTACDTQDLTLHDYFLEKRNLKNVFPPNPGK